jgi:phosphatidylglycerophosphatase A
VSSVSPARAPGRAASGARTRAPTREGAGRPIVDRVARAIALWFGCGLVPRAPGTAGSIGALPLYFLVRGGGPYAVLASAVVVTIVGIWAAGIVADRTGMEDPQIVVVDEVAGSLLALTVAPPSWAGIAVAIVAFRFFDIVKPFPARRAEHLPRGWGIMMDDIAAGVWAASVVVALRALGALA